MLLHFLRSDLTSLNRPNMFILPFIRSVGHEYVRLTKTNAIKFSK